MYERVWQCLECGRVYQDEPARCKCGQPDLKSVMRETEDGSTAEE
jgi:hypothetical protein